MMIGCGQQEQKKENEHEEKVLFPVVCQDALPGKIHHILNSQGRLETRRIAHISPEVDGRISSIVMEEGMIVKEGDLLVQLSTPPGVDLDMKRFQLQIDQNLLTLKRQETLRSKAPAAISKSDIEATKLQVNELKLDLNKLQEMARYRSIRAPFDGALMSVQGEIGQQVGRGTLLARLHNLDEYRLSVDIPESRLHQIKLNQKIDLQLLSDGSRGSGRVSFLPSSIDENRGSGKVLVSIKQKPLHWKIGAFVMLQFQMDLIEGDIVIDKSIIAYKQNRPYVWIAQKKDDGYLSKRVWVKEGKKDSENVIILEGLSKGDKVIVKGLRGMREGLRLKIN